ncbi:MAG: hypothetical protein M1511_18600 [Deltaproteobacteria bacterium]|nr:hypothetical protein [Deltaproteobacteria bacterium]
MRLQCSNTAATFLCRREDRMLNQLLGAYAPRMSGVMARCLAREIPILLNNTTLVGLLR